MQSTTEARVITFAQLERNKTCVCVQHEGRSVRCTCGGGWGRQSTVRSRCWLEFGTVTDANCLWGIGLLARAACKVLLLISCQKVCSKFMKLHAHYAYAALNVDNLLIEFDCNLILCLLWRKCVGGWA